MFPGYVHSRPLPTHDTSTAEIGGIYMPAANITVAAEDIPTFSFVPVSRGTDIYTLDVDWRLNQ